MPANQPNTIPIPVPNHDNAGFWEGCRRHELCLQLCLKCREYRHHPRPMCPHCNSLEYEWARVSGRGTLYSFTIAHGPTLGVFQEGAPYNVVAVQLDEGPFMISNIVDCSNDELQIGRRVEVCFADINKDISLPKFRLLPHGKS